MSFHNLSRNPARLINDHVHREGRPSKNHAWSWIGLTSRKQLSERRDALIRAQHRVRTLVAVLVTGESLGGVVQQSQIAADRIGELNPRVTAVISALRPWYPGRRT